MDSRFRGNDEVGDGCPKYRHSRESGNPLPVSDPSHFVMRQYVERQEMSAMTLQRRAVEEIRQSGFLRWFQAVRSN